MSETIKRGEIKKARRQVTGTASSRQAAHRAFSFTLFYFQLKLHNKCPNKIIMLPYLIMFFQHNLARRHEPTAAMNQLLLELAPFSFLSRTSEYLEKAITTSCFPFVLEALREHVGTMGVLPRILPVALVQEPVLVDGRPGGFNNHSVRCYQDSSRAAIITLACADLTLLSQYTNRDCATAILVAGKRRLWISSFYYDITHNELPINVNNWKDLACDLVIAGDTNGHSSMWGSPSNNLRGDQCEEFIFLNNLNVANIGREPTFKNHIGQSHIDVTLSYSDRVSNWTNTGIQHGSDHYLLTFMLATKDPTIVKYHQNIARTDWNVFTSTLKSLEDTEIINTKQLEHRAEILVNNIKEAYDQACPPKKAYPGKPCKWWSQTLSTLLRKKNLAAREARRYAGTLRGVRARQKKVALGRLFNKHAKISKREAWQSFVTNLDSPKTISGLYKSMTNKKNFDLPMLKGTQGNWATSHAENLAILRESHFNNSTCDFEYDRGSLTRPPELPRDLNNFLTWEMLQKAVEELPNGKAPGPDGIRNEVIRKLPDYYLLELLRQFRMSIRSGFIPSCWLNIKTIYIRKPGKPDGESPKTYRPIGLSSCILKLCERLVNWRLKCTVQNQGIPKQHAFTVNKSTDSALSELVNVLEKAKYKGLKAMVLSIDIQGAFDSVPFDEIKSALQVHGAESHVTEWLDFLSRNRVMYTTQGRETLAFRPLEGTTQGGLNGPDLWAIFLWNIILIRAMRDSQSLKFADDLNATIIGVCIKVLRDLMQGCLNEFNEWFSSRGLKISATKSTCMIIDSSLRPRYPEPLTLNGIPIPYVTEMKYLGVIIDNKLTWKPHIRNRLAKAKRGLMQAKKLISDNWGLTPDKVLWIYESIVRPALDYSCHVWAHVDAWPQWVLKELTKVQRLALLCSTRAQKSTPTRALERLTNIMPLHLHIKQKAACIIARIFETVNKANWDGVGINNKRGHLLKWKLYLTTEIPPIKPVHLYNFPPLGIDTTGKVNPCDMTDIPVVYTDGSKLNNSVGLGWCICLNDAVLSEGCGKLPQHTSVYEAELLAIESAIVGLTALVTQGKLQHRTVHFFIDNKAAIFTLNQVRLTGVCRVRVVRCIKKFISETGIELTFNWVKGHNDITGNEFADSKAKEGCETNNLIHCGPSITYIKGRIKERVNKEWDTLWESLTDCRQSRELISYKPCKKERAYLISRGSLSCKKLVALLTGHNNLRYHTFKRVVGTNPNFSPCCRFCEEDVETSWHLLYDCPILETKRREFMYSPDNPKTGPDILWYDRLASHLGIMNIVLERCDNHDLDNSE